VKNRAGFTLIELIVVITIFGVFISFYSANFFKQKESKNLETAATDLRVYLANLRQKSLTVLVPSGVSSDDFLGYGFQIQTDSDSNQVDGLYFDTGGSTSLNKPFKIDNYKHISLVSPVSNTTRYFQIGDGILLNESSVSATIEIKLKNTQLNQCYSLSISKQGIITTDEKASCE
jgi:prepilin-type N-terminal cleavage/methylation domain-containing protein